MLNLREIQKNYLLLHLVSSKPLQSVVLDEVKNLSLQGILLLHAEVVSVPAYCSPEC